MSTLVPTPEIAQTQISGLAPVQRGDQSNGGLGSFLSSFLPEAGKAISQYQEENKAYNIALGMNDSLNQVHREVSFLDRANYEYGITYQNTMSEQAALQKDFLDRLQQIDTKDPDPSKFYDMTKEYLDNTVTAIHNSNLPKELKEQLYVSTIKENAVYTKLVQDKMQQIASNSAFESRRDMTGKLVRALSEESFTAEELSVTIEAFADNYYASRVAEKPYENVTREDVQEGLSKELGIAFDFVMDQIKAAGTSGDTAKLQQLMDVADKLVEYDVSLANRVQTKGMQLESDIMQNNSSHLTYEVDGILTEWVNDPSTLTQATLESALGNIMARDNVTTQAKVREASRLSDAYRRHQEKLMSAEETNIQLYGTPSDYQRIGKTPEKWAKDWYAHILKGSGDTLTAGVEAMRMGATGAEYSPELIKLGSEAMFRNLSGTLTMTDEELKNDPYYQQRKENFEKAAALYRNLKLNNGSRALDMLSGVDQRHVAAFETALENGGKLESLREAMKNPATVSAQYSGYDKAMEGITSSHLGLNDELLGGHGGTRTRNMADALEDTYVDMVKGVLTSSKSSYVSMIQGSSPNGLLGVAKRDILLPSENGYSSIIMPKRARNVINGMKVMDSNEPLHTSYVSKAIDKQREAIAKNYGVRPDNVIARVDDTGKTVQFFAYKSEGLLGKTAVLVNGNESGILSGGTVPLTAIRSEASKLHKADRSGAKKALDGNIRIGQTVVHDLSAPVMGGRRVGNNVKLSANYGKALGGNTGLATEFINHLGIMEGFTSKPLKPADANTGKVSTVYGMGVTEDNMGSEGTKRMFRQAAGDPQKIMDLQGEFMVDYYKKLNINKDIQRVGIPAPSSGAYPSQYKKSLMLVYDVGWHGHNGGLHGVRSSGKKVRDGVVDAMNAPTLKQGLSMLRNTTVYNRKNPKSKRNVWMEDALKSHFKAMGKM